jgi:hypothetical protein
MYSVIFGQKNLLDDYTLTMSNVLDDLNHVYPGLLQGEKSLQTEALRSVKVF